MEQERQREAELLRLNREAERQHKERLDALEEKGRLEYEALKRGLSSPGIDTSKLALPLLPTRPSSREQRDSIVTSPRAASATYTGTVASCPTSSLAQASSMSSAYGDVDEHVSTTDRPTKAESSATKEVVIENEEASPTQLSLLVGQMVTFRVHEDEAPMLEFEWSVQRISAAKEDSVENTSNSMEGDVVAKSEVLCSSGQTTWSYCFSHPGVYFASDRDYAPDCDVRFDVTLPKPERSSTT